MNSESYLDSVHRVTVRQTPKSKSSYPARLIMHTLFFETGPLTDRETVFTLGVARYYLLQHYSPEQVPNLYAFIEGGLGMKINWLSMMPSMHGTIQSIKMRELSLYHLKEADKFLEIKEKESRNEESSHLPIVLGKKIAFIDPMFHGKVLSQLSKMYSYSNELKNTIFYLNKARNYFINHHREYTIYSATDGIQFVVDYIKEMLLRFDFNEQQSDYHRKWMHLLMKSAKILKHCPMHQWYDHYGDCFIHLGIISFLWFPKRTNQAIKYLIRGIKAMQKDVKYNFTLWHGYDCLILIYEHMRQYNECKK